MTTFALALLSILMSVAAQFILKAGVRSAQAAGAAPDATARLVATLLHPQVLAGLACYAGSAVVWLAVLGKWDVSKAYPLVGLGFVLTLPVGWMLGEQVGAQRLAGALLIAVGVVLVGRS